MAKKDKISGEVQAAPVVETPATQAAPEAAAKSPVGQRGLKGVPLTAKITLIAATNPKRPGCAAEKRFALYETGKTVEAFLNEGGTTPDLVYDASHGFISVEGYTPKKMFTPKAKAEPKPKKEKAAKEVKGETVSTAQVEAETQSETVE